MRHSKNIGGICDSGHHHFCLECWPRVLTPKREKTIKKKRSTRKKKRKRNPSFPAFAIWIFFLFLTPNQTLTKRNRNSTHASFPFKALFCLLLPSLPKPENTKKEKKYNLFVFFYFFFQNQIAYDFLCGRTCRGSLIFISFLLFRFTFSLSTAASVAKAGET